MLKPYSKAIDFDVWAYVSYGSEKNDIVYGVRNKAEKETWQSLLFFARYTEHVKDQTRIDSGLAKIKALRYQIT